MRLQTKRKILEYVRRLLKMPQDLPFDPPQQTVIRYDIHTERVGSAVMLDRFLSSAHIDQWWEKRAKIGIARGIATLLERGGYIKFFYTTDGGLHGRLTVAKPVPIEYRGEQLTWRETDIGREILQRERGYE